MGGLQEDRVFLSWRDDMKRGTKLTNEIRVIASQVPQHAKSIRKLPSKKPSLSTNKNTLAVPNPPKPTSHKGKSTKPKQTKSFIPEPSTSDPMQNYCPLRKYKETITMPITSSNNSTSLDPKKHYIVTLEQIAGDSNRHEFSTTPNPLYLYDCKKDKELDHQPMGDPPDVGDWDMDSLIDDPDDNDYKGYSSDEEFEYSESVGSLDDENQLELREPGL